MVVSEPDIKGHAILLDTQGLLGFRAWDVTIVWLAAAEFATVTFSSISGSWRVRGIAVRLFRVWGLSVNRLEQGASYRYQERQTQFPERDHA